MKNERRRREERKVTIAYIKTDRKQTTSTNEIKQHFIPSSGPEVNTLLQSNSPNIFSTSSDVEIPCHDFIHSITVLCVVLILTQIMTY